MSGGGKAVNVDKIHHGLEVIIGVTFLLGIFTAAWKLTLRANAGEMGSDPKRAKTGDFAGHMGGNVACLRGFEPPTF
jgi:hypothetical protein